ncbi:unnamed protein product [Microthlaspi erraticum]|uniref:Uncharacterized protein n=1 Tax=Microthlaspi erraticum TaxID=1685480 RepID=A0A6D2I0M5_9BRAS|nr:unnamed protein product [Microthlaspi erraticum]
MEPKVDEEAGNNGAKEVKVALLKEQDFPEIERNTWIHKAIGQTFQTTAHLANLLPTGTLLAYQVLSPIFTNGGRCDLASRFMTELLVSICGLSCFILSFTDSYKDLNGNVCYGIATTNGLWIIDGKAVLPKERSQSYKLRFIDFTHAIMSVLVFGAVVMFDHNVVSSSRASLSLARSRRSLLQFDVRYISYYTPWYRIPSLCSLLNDVLTQNVKLS